MNKNQLSAKVIVGSDRHSEVLEYANRFPFPVLLDANGDYFDKAEIKSVPYFAVTNRSGEILTQATSYGDFNQLRKKLELIDL